MGQPRNDLSLRSGRHEGLPRVTRALLASETLGKAERIRSPRSGRSKAAGATATLILHSNRRTSVTPSGGSTAITSIPRVALAKLRSLHPGLYSGRPHSRAWLVARPRQKAKAQKPARQAWRPGDGRHQAVPVPPPPRSPPEPTIEAPRTPSR